MLGLCCCSRAFSSCSEQGRLSSCSVQASHCSGFSCCRAWALECNGLQQLQYMGSLVVACGLHCLEACGILVPGPGICTMSPALAGGFLTAEPPGKSLHVVLMTFLLCYFPQIHTECMGPTGCESSGRGAEAAVISGKAPAQHLALLWRCLDIVFLTPPGWLTGLRTMLRIRNFSNSTALHIGSPWPANRRPSVGWRRETLSIRCWVAERVVHYWLSVNLSLILTLPLDHCVTKTSPFNSVS